MWSLYYPTGQSEYFQGVRGPLSRLLALCVRYGWTESQEVVEKILEEGVSGRDLRDTYLVKTPIGVFQVDNTETRT